MDGITGFKVSIVAICGAISAAFGWLGWLVIAFIACMTVDWITGSMAACKSGEWQSKRARQGLWSKTGCLIAVLVAFVLDGVIGSVINNIPSINLPFTYYVLLAPIVMLWYILTELGSIIENVGRMGAPVPSFLQKAISVLRGATDAAGNKIIDSAEDAKPPDNK